MAICLSVSSFTIVAVTKTTLRQHCLWGRGMGLLIKAMPFLGHPLWIEDGHPQTLCWGRSFLEAISQLFVSCPQSLSEYQGHLLWLSRRRWPQTPGWKPEPRERSRSLCQPGGHWWPLLGQNLTHWNLGSPGESSRAGEWQKVGFQLQLSPQGSSYPWLRWPYPLWRNRWGQITYLLSLSIYFSYWFLKHIFFKCM